MFPTENIVKSYESAIVGKKRTLIGQVNGRSFPMVQTIKLLELKLITQNFQSDLSYNIHLSLESCHYVSIEFKF